MLCIGGDDVVSLVIGQFDSGKIESLHRLAHQRELRDEILRRRRPVRLILRIDAVAEGRAARIKNDGHIVRRMLLQQFYQHVDEYEHGGDRRAVAAGELALWRVISTEDETRAVDEIDFFGGGHILY